MGGFSFPTPDTRAPAFPMPNTAPTIHSPSRYVPPNTPPPSPRQRRSPAPVSPAKGQREETSSPTSPQHSASPGPAPPLRDRRNSVKW